jgi:two-component system NtrC family response regulator
MRQFSRNVRELANKVRGAAVTARGPMITAQELGIAAGEVGDTIFELRDARARAERQAVRQVLQIIDSNVSHAAALFGITRSTGYDLMQTDALLGNTAVCGEDA